MGVTALCVALTFYPLKWVHPLREAALRGVTLIVSALWAVAAIWAVASGFPAGVWTCAALAAGGGYGLALSLWHGRARV